ncbi:ChuX/HutX family heme-like substrate-binding protein [Chryseolinea sp. H1M3-3]|uniref:hemin-degrading factor n=1 Tax=Chryseolinea sp. H1M3-3 TaxID=3034144 RepID=UPI0023EB948A|nr:ChuX/HutX family heme-like substrate-binding protein [Chryseolinea sp. H1M3-3]
MNTTIEAQSTLRQAWLGIQKAKPGIRIRDAAAALGCSEAELLATTVNDYTTRLEGDWTKLVQRLPELGRVMSLTRNDSCVLEHKGPFQKIDVMGSLPQAMATVVGPIETRIFFNAWKFGYAVRQQTPQGLQQSLQFFDASGTAITKIFLQQPTGNKTGSNQDAFDCIVKDFEAADQFMSVEVTKISQAPTKKIDEVNKTALLEDWGAMKDTHDFFGMIRKYNVNRLDALHLAKDQFTYQIDKGSLRILLEMASTEKLPIMIFAGNSGNLQIHQGKVQTIRVMDAWLNILDPDFNMHLREDHVHTAWVVKKPTTDGIVTGIEVFDSGGTMIVQFFGLRKPGIRELETWRKLVSDLPRI